jgi:hypothetical protein
MYAYDSNFNKCFPGMQMHLKIMMASVELTREKKKEICDRSLTEDCQRVVIRDLFNPVIHSCKVFLLKHKFHCLSVLYFFLSIFIWNCYQGLFLNPIFCILTCP